MVGDPSGKSETRPALTKEEVDENAKSYFEQMSKVVDIKNAEIVNNADWLHKLSFVDTLKLSSQITVAQMLTREDFPAFGRPTMAIFGRSSRGDWLSTLVSTSSKPFTTSSIKSPVPLPLVEAIEKISPSPRR